MKKCENIRDIMAYMEGGCRVYHYENTAQYITGCGLEVNLSSFFSQLIREAARCNDYCSDVIYDISAIREAMEAFNPCNYPNTGSSDSKLPVFALGFRKLGVDGNLVMLSRLKDDIFDIYKEYFAVYFMEVKRHGKYNDWWEVEMNGYHV